MADQETNVVTETTEQNTNTEQTVEKTSPADENAEIARLKAELAKQKAAIDKATKEAGDYKKQLRAKQTAEEAAAEEAQAHQEAMEKELAELRKERAVANASKKAFTLVQDESVANAIAEAGYGAEDFDLLMDLVGKAWTAREKALKIEYGKVPAPGIGASDGVTITKTQLDGMGYKERLDFATKHPDEYQKLMGR